MGQVMKKKRVENKAGFKFIESFESVVTRCNKAL